MMFIIFIKRTKSFIFKDTSLNIIFMKILSNILINNFLNFIDISIIMNIYSTIAHLYIS